MRLRTNLPVVEFAGGGSAEECIGQYATEYKTEPGKYDPEQGVIIAVA